MNIRSAIGQEWVEASPEGESRAAYHAFSEQKREQDYPDASKKIPGAKKHQEGAEEEEEEEE